MAIRAQYLQTQGEHPPKHVMLANWGAGGVVAEGDTPGEALSELIVRIAVDYDVTKLRGELGI